MKRLRCRDLGRWIKIIGAVVSVSIIAGMLLLVVLVATTPLQRPMQIMGGSMGDEAPAGTIIFFREVPEKSLAPDDLIVFHTQPGCDAKYEVVAHAFQGYNEDGTLRTQGAAMENLDDCVIHDDDVIGKVAWKTPDFMASVLLTAVSLLKSWTGLGFIACVIVTVVLVSLLVRVMRQS